MRFDDRLQTLNDAQPGDSRDRAVRWRQLVDLLSRMGRLEGTVVTQALEIVEEDARLVDAEIRAATIRSIAGRAIDTPLLKILAEQPLAISGPLFAGRAMTASEAREVLANADPSLRAIVRIEAEPGPSVPASAPEKAAEPPSIGAMVDRIEQLRRDRANPPRSAPAVPPGTVARPASEGSLFRWESDATGHIAWVAGAPRGALIGRPLGGEGVALLEPEAEARVVQRHPFNDVRLAAAGALEGEWTATGVPSFDPATGRFLGYRGLARRIDAKAEIAAARVRPRGGDADTLRELVHEIKTPLNAIIGFAEIIDGQYLGPADARYRDRAADIVEQAGKLLEAVEDLDFAAALGARQRSGGKGSRLADVFGSLSDELARCLDISGGHLVVDIDDERQRCALAAELAERLARRLLLALCAHVRTDEAFRIAISSSGSQALLLIGRPAVLQGFDEATLLDPAFDASPDREASVMGLGFALRLVRGLARVAGGDLLIDPRRITLSLPALDR